VFHEKRRNEEIPHIHEHDLDLLSLTFCNRACSRLFVKKRKKKKKEKRKKEKKEKEKKKGKNQR
jgi:uncharacterized protein YutD